METHHLSGCSVTRRIRIEAAVDFITAVNNAHENTDSNYDRLILLMRPEKYGSIQESLYERLLSVCNMVSNFSDGYALLLHKKIKGVDLN